ncbi:MAG: hypothetical protein APR55_09105 [Methanolinea sp. SDB]|nr:MAG: hypothetical protein APR55_09105 [Methanolinea sp. SDB]
MIQKFKKTPFWALVSGLAGIVVFLVALLVLRFIAGHTASPFLDGFVSLLFASTPVIIIFSVLFMVADVFSSFPLPANLPYPVFNAVASVLLVTFLLSMLQYFNEYFALGFGGVLDTLTVILIPLVLVVVLIAGYVAIFTGLSVREE